MKILIALDGSEFSEAAAKAVIDQVKPENNEVALLQALEPFPVALAEKVGSKESPDFTVARLKLRDEATDYLARIAEQFRSAGFKSSYFVDEGDAREVILDYAERWPADLVVVGSHGRKGLNRFLIGSVSEAVARHARCSVEIVRMSPEHEMDAARASVDSKTH
jgi:nucleotide-binding universal stress UspA family protein